MQVTRTHSWRSTTYAVPYRTPTCIPMSDATMAPLRAAILGTDVFLAAGTNDPVQVIRACSRAGFDFVAPVIWGDELIATYLAERATRSTAAVTFAVACPRVHAALERTGIEPDVVRTVTPPVACARYLRAAFLPRPVHVTFFGACAGADQPELDARHQADALLARLAESGIDPSREPRVFDDQLPVEMARYASVAAGMPDEAIVATSGMRIVEAAAATAHALAHIHAGRVLVDLGRSAGCDCARLRTAWRRIEPPRSPTPVVVLSVSVAAERQGGADATAVVEDMPRASFAEQGLSAGEVELPPPLANPFTQSREPW